MRLVGYAYPWDVIDDNAFVDRARDLGVDEVAVATAYHSTRAATPWQLDRAAVLAEHAALYRPIRESAWGDRSLAPLSPAWMSTSDSAGMAVERIREAGLKAAAWIVLTHSTALGRRRQEFTVRDCFGQSYPWALCPSHPEVRAYAATLAAESIRGLAVDSVVLEACGQLGVTHQCTHEKTDGVWSPAAMRLLSICCCDGCAENGKTAGLDPDEVRAQLRVAARAEISGNSGSVGDESDRLSFDRGLLAELLAVRQANTDALRRAVLAAVGADVRVSLHGHPDPWQTGALVGITPTTVSDVDTLVVPCWQPGAESVENVAAARAAGAESVGAYVTAVGPNPHQEIGSYVGELARAGADELHLYHLGLAGPMRWPLMRAAAEAAARTRS